MVATAALISEEADTLNAIEHIKPTHRRVLDIFPGVAGGMARVLVGQPFDTVKTRMQVRTCRGVARGRLHGAAALRCPAKWHLGMQCCLQLRPACPRKISTAVESSRHIPH